MDGAGGQLGRGLRGQRQRVSSDRIVIRWQSGEAELWPQMWVPATQKKLRDLKKLLSLDPAAAEKAVPILLSCVATAGEQLEVERVFAGKDYWNLRQAAAEKEDCLHTGTWPNGLPLSREDRKGLKKCAKQERNAAEKALRRFLRAKKDKEKLLKNAEEIARWRFNQ